MRAMAERNGVSTIDTSFVRMRNSTFLISCHGATEWTAATPARNLTSGYCRTVLMRRSGSTLRSGRDGLTERVPVYSHATDNVVIFVREDIEYAAGSGSFTIELDCNVARFRIEHVLHEDVGRGLGCIIESPGAASKRMLAH